MAFTWMHRVAVLVNRTSQATSETDWLKDIHNHFAQGRAVSRDPTRSVIVTSGLVHGRPKVEFDSCWLGYGSSSVTRELGDVLWLYERHRKGEATVWRAAVWQVKYRNRTRRNPHPSFSIDAGQMDLLANLPPFRLKPSGGEYYLSESSFLGWFCYAQRPLCRTPGGIATIVPARCWPSPFAATGAQAVLSFLHHLSGTAPCPWSADLQRDGEAKSLICEILRQRAPEDKALAKIYARLCTLCEAIDTVMREAGGRRGRFRSNRSLERNRPFLVVHIYEYERDKRTE